MGDRCYIEVTCLRKDRSAFADIFDLTDDEPPTIAKERVIVIVDDEANWALQVPDGWPEDIPYVGFHGAGDNYDSEVFACDGKQLVCVPSREGRPNVAVSEKGARKKDVDEAKLYWKVYERAMEMLHPGKKKKEKK